MINLKSSIAKKYFLAILYISLSIQISIAQKSIVAEIANPEIASKYTTEVVVGDMQIPWGMAFLPDGSILITEKSGELILFKNGIKTIIEGLPDIYLRGQGGLMDLELHPDFEKNGWIYISYASSEGEETGGNTAIMRAKLVNNTLVDKQLIYKAVPNTSAGAHWGSRMEFDNEGYLYFSIGDRFNRDVNPQNIELDGGKIYRVHDDGRIPTDNPFVNIPNAKKAVYSFGHRNTQGMAKHPQTGEIWTHEHGPKGGDEINIIQKGENYGWPKATYGINYNGSIITEHSSLPDVKQPLFYWIPSIAPSGMAFITSDKYPEWKGNLLVGSLVFQYLELLTLDNNNVVKREKLYEGIGRVRNVRQGIDGYIYLGVEGVGIVRIISKNE